MPNILSTFDTHLFERKTGGPSNTVMNESTVIKTLFSLYNLGWTAAVPFLKRNPRISDGFDQRALAAEPLPRADIWIQSASAGEAYLTWEILKNLEVDGETTLLATANTRQGLDILEQAKAEINGRGGPLRVQARFSPFDKPALMEEAVNTVRPSLMVLVELEIWPGLLKALKKADCPVLIVNGRLTERSLKRYLLLPRLWEMLAPAVVLAMSGPDADRFRKLFPESRVAEVPNIKFDRTPVCAVEDDAEKTNPLSVLVGGEKKVVVLGSVREEEEEEVARIIERLIRDLPECRIFLFPRHMHRLDAWETRLSAMNADFTRRSLLTSEPPQVLLWDVFGELAFAYRLARAAFIGGSLAPLGGQNFLEALAAGVIPVTGPSWDNFAWVGQGIVDQGLLDVGVDVTDVANRLIRHAMNPMDRNRVQILTEDYLKPLRGGTAKVCREMEELLKPRKQTGEKGKPL